MPASGPSPGARVELEQRTLQGGHDGHASSVHHSYTCSISRFASAVSTDRALAAQVGLGAGVASAGCSAGGRRRGCRRRSGGRLGCHRDATVMVSRGRASCPPSGSWTMTIARRLLVGLPSVCGSLNPASLRVLLGALRGSPRPGSAPRLPGRVGDGHLGRPARRWSPLWAGFRQHLVRPWSRSAREAAFASTDC